jgi:hypothetical protein
VRRTPNTLRAALVLLALALVPAACGGDDDEEATPTNTETAVLAENVRLDEESWDRYVETRDAARATNQQAIVTFRKCRDLLGTDVPAEEVEECLGTAATDVVAEGMDVLAVLDELGTEVSGACADATATLRGNIKLYIATVNAIALDLERSSLPTGQDVGTSLQQLETSQAAAAEFERVCKPV